MEKTGFTYALIGVFLMFVAFSADARPQFQNDLVEVDGFVFDGPVERSNKFPNNNRRTFPDFPPPNPNPEITGTTTTTPSPDMTRCLQNCPVTAQYNPHEHILE
ncbi:uncharacterized protein [Fopius arisanus]|uniref:Uncharacterized protein n=1 Tax=Fopius arisanus TaxID=64838 RepID=A0A9R1U9C5_9HYME|nr:PREDICTED: uncharacterized protein LOC105273234 [Fopius arisanus]